MRKPYFFGITAVVALLLVGGIAGGLVNGSTSAPFSLQWKSSTPQPAVTDVKECNEYARWIVERDGSGAEREMNGDERLLHDALINTGTLEGLAESNQQNARAADAYRRCMVRRGYRAWG